MGKVRHLDDRFLWLQQLTAEGILKLAKRDGIDNESDMGTKHLEEKRLFELLQRTPLRPPGGWLRAAAAAALMAKSDAYEVQVWVPYDPVPVATSDSDMVLRLALAVVLLFGAVVWLTAQELGRWQASRAQARLRDAETQTTRVVAMQYRLLTVHEMQAECQRRGIVPHRTRGPMVDALARDDSWTMQGPRDVPLTE